MSTFIINVIICSMLQEARRLQAAGTFQQLLVQMYAFGKEHGWGPVTWVDGIPAPLPT